MTNRPLDLDAVRAFVRITELGSFTRAAQSMQATQSAVSLKLKRLEDRLDCRLIERTPRQVRLSAEGAAFLDHARALLGAHDSAVHALCTTRQRLTVGISDYVAGPELSLLIARLTAQDPQLLIDIRIASSKDLAAVRPARIRCRCRAAEYRSRRRCRDCRGTLWLVCRA